MSSPWQHYAWNYEVISGKVVNSLVMNKPLYTTQSESEKKLADETIYLAIDRTQWQ